MSKLKRLGTFFILTSALGVIVIPLIASAEDASGTPLIVPIPGFETTAGSNLTSYLKAIFTYGLGLAALIAMAQLVFGAVQYTTSAGAPSLQEDAKSRMRSSIIGMVLLILSVAILSIINLGVFNSRAVYDRNVAEQQARDEALKKASEEAKKQRVIGAANAEAFRKKVVDEIVPMVPPERSAYVEEQARRTNDAEEFKQRYGNLAAADVQGEYVTKLIQAVAEVKTKISTEEFDQMMNGLDWGTQMAFAKVGITWNTP